MRIEDKHPNVKIEFSNELIYLLAPKELDIDKVILIRELINFINEDFKDLYSGEEKLTILNNIEKDFNNLSL